MQSALSAPKETPGDREFRAVGPLTALGLSDRWQAALVLPVTYRAPLLSGQDHRRPPLGAAVKMFVTSVAAPRSFYNGAPRVLLSLLDGVGEVFRATVFGNTKDWEARMAEGSTATLRLRFEDYKGARTATVLSEVVDADPWASRVEPIYPGIPGALAHQKVREAVIAYLPDAIPRACRELQERLVKLGPIETVLAHVGAGGWTIEQLLQQAHEPCDLAYAEFAREMLLKLSGLIQLMKLDEHNVPTHAARSFALTSIVERERALPFALTADQRTAIQEMADRMRQGETLRAVLMGDVASGKTAVFGVLAAAIADEPVGARAAIMLPNAVLAQQVARELRSYWPDLPIMLVTGETAVDADVGLAKILVGTSALLHRHVGPLDLVIVDEEQKFANEQKTQLVAFGAHLITVTATCIPRTLALARYGALSVSVLREVHVLRSIQTTLREASKEARSTLFCEIRQDIRMGHQVLIVYPARDRQSVTDLHSVEAARDAWAEHYDVSKIRTLTGEDSDATKASVMADMREGRAQLLLSTTVVEVGITLKKLIRVVVMRPQYFGASQLHQLRGRAARHGGDGYFDMQLTGPVSDKTLNRLQILVECSNGFEVAERDLDNRGYGDLAVDSTRQSGDGGVLFGQPCPVALTDALLPVYQVLRTRVAPFTDSLN